MLIGTSTSAHQVEGNDRNTDWWHFESNGRIKFKSESGCMQYKHYKEDIKLMKKLKLNAYRFEINFSRIMPSPGIINKTAIKHYKSVIEELNKNGIEPIPTLWHYTLPLWFYNLHGFEKKENFSYFIKYVDALLESGLDVKYILTINEPVIYASKAYLYREYPPFRTSYIMFNKVLNNILALHNEVYDILKANGYTVSFANNFMEFKSDAVLYPITKALDYTFNQRPLLQTRFDFIGINYYKTVDAIKFIRSKIIRDKKKIWYVDPKGLEKTAEREHLIFRKPIMITENGIDTLDDAYRIKFINEHFAALLKARRKGVPVLGYLHWSFIDNFEWNFGYNRNYGVIGFDNITKRRIIKPSAFALRNLAIKYAK
ncbi:family 1 glycosylhydrolase [Candidatus Parvarchaeota archaeon]|jgi:beta-glucosidase|nr:family 1 glycosylhydrolase [Candidatus Parvarchaeota archaeon]